MGMSSGAAFIAAIVAVLFLLKIEKDELENTQQEMERETKGYNPPKNSEKISKKEYKENTEETTKASATEEQLIGSSKTADRDSKNKFTMTNEQAEVIYRFLSGISFIGFIFVMVHMLYKMLSRSISLIDGVLSIAFFCLCSYGWMTYTQKWHEAKNKLEKENIKE